jgi:hypothetical protein
MKFDDIELIVSDNFSRTPASEILADVSDKRLRVIRTDRRMPGSDHWEFAFEHVRGEYVMYVGDDNALHPDILAFADSAIREYDLDVISWRVCSYFHPDWNITYGPLPNRGNVLGIDVGTTGGLYICHADAVLKSYGQSLRLSGCFPCMLNFLFRKRGADAIRERAGRFFWAPNPDISSSFFMLGTSRPGRYAFLDSFGAIGGRSRESNLATMLSRGKATKRGYEYIEEFVGKDMLPHHNPKFISVSNALASTISQARKTMPDRFGAFNFDGKTLARKTIDDMYVDRTVPWIDDTAFLAEVDLFIASLPAADAAEIFAYREECLALMTEADKIGEAGPSHVRNSDEARISLLDFLRTADADSKAFAWRLFCETGRNPLGRYWIAGGTTYVDMSLYGGRDIADAARNLPRVLAAFDKYGEAFVNYHRQIGMIGECLSSIPAVRRQKFAPRPMAMAG